ncbi:hypothetical protein F4801DRAFT_582663 [Xylaria longipes]|nr:hypothetical protein F4801DRAFT_582663 [Xylaria longipes]
MSTTDSKEPKPYRLYVALYNVSRIYHWAFVIRDNKNTFVLDATYGNGQHNGQQNGERRYRNLN